MRNSDFDKSSSRNSKLGFIIVIVDNVIKLSLFGGLAWVAWHFISKVW